MDLEHIIAHPTQRRYARPLLLIHGAWHAAWCWEVAQPDLAARGFEVHAISLRGHGNSPRPANFRRSTVVQYASDVRAAINAIGNRPIVVAHSLGGLLLQLLITGVLGPVPDIAGAIMLCTSPVSLRDYFTPRQSEEPISLSEMLRFEPKAMRATLFRRDINEADLLRHVARLVPEPPMMTMSSMFLRPRPTRCRTPMLVIAAEKDAVYGLPTQRSTAAAYRCGLVVVPESAHNIMLDPAWPVAAEAIERFAANL